MSDNQPLRREEVDSVEEVGGEIRLIAHNCCRLQMCAGGLTGTPKEKDAIYFRVEMLITGALLELFMEAWPRSAGPRPVVKRIEGHGRAPGVDMAFDGEGGNGWTSTRFGVAPGVTLSSPGSRILRALSQTWELGDGALRFVISTESLVAGLKQIPGFEHLYDAQPAPPSPEPGRDGGGTQGGG